LQERLGSAITKRRSYLSYARDHKTMLDVVPTAEPALIGSVFLGATLTKPTTYVPTASPLGSVEKLTTMSETRDDSSTLTTISPSVDSEVEHSLNLRIPSLESLRVGNSKEVECLICFRVHTFKSEKAWR
ncbi:hypothetical protein CC86DRAFT_282266, partial [Ophiobolus disseminans]